MMDRNENRGVPTDMMHRRTPLPFCKRFLWLGVSVTIQTDSTAILRAAESVEFLPQSDLAKESQMYWEIATEPHGTVHVDAWVSKVTVDNHSLFLNMGDKQWFVFDFESGEGAGFFTNSDLRDSANPNATKYLSEIACHVGNCLLDKPERNGRS